MRAFLRFPDIGRRIVVVLASTTALGFISGSADGTVSPPPVNAVPAETLLSAESIPGPREVYELRPDRSDVDVGAEQLNAPECADVVRGRVLPRSGATGHGLEIAVGGGRFSELVARVARPVDLTAWGEQARRCGTVTVSGSPADTVSTVSVQSTPDIPGVRTLAYHQDLALPGQPPALRLRTVVLAVDDLLIVLRDVGETALDLDSLAQIAWQQAAPRLGR